MFNGCRKSPANLFGFPNILVVRLTISDGALISRYTVAFDIPYQCSEISASRHKLEIKQIMKVYECKELCKVSLSKIVMFIVCRSLATHYGYGHCWCDYCWCDYC